MNKTIKVLSKTKANKSTVKNVNIKNQHYLHFLTITFILLSISAFGQQNFQRMGDKKIIIYQLLPRLFGNKNTTNVPYGTIEQNGCGKFNDITDKALDGLKELHVNYVWYTGVIAHASLTDYSKFGIEPGNANVVKGRAGSPYAIRDYYDVDPDLAVDVKNRMSEFEALIKRTHNKGLKLLIDFVPNHVARSYQSNAKPKGAIDFGVNDDKSVVFSDKNDFYYIPGQALNVPENLAEANSPLKDLRNIQYKEDPAKATGNNVFSASPSHTDWYETVKLNYGIEYKDGKEIHHFDPIPPVWAKMRDILIYWTKKGVDGFRCDVAEMVPVEFWQWVIPQVKAVKPDLIFMAEAYNPKVYEKYLTQGKFDFLYDKVGLYDGLKRLIKNETNGDVKDIAHVWQQECKGFDDKMVRFLENHDEERIAANVFARNPELALPAMVVTATLGKGPVMLYFGQEVGEPGAGNEGFTGDDVMHARTTIFDYWGVPNHQKWMNDGKVNGARLSKQENELRNYYANLLKIVSQSDAIKFGDIFQVPQSGNMNNKMYAFIRYSAKQRLLIVVNFDREQTLKANIEIPANIIDLHSPVPVTDLITNRKLNTPGGTAVPVKLPPVSAQIIEF